MPHTHIAADQDILAQHGLTATGGQPSLTEVTHGTSTGWTRQRDPALDGLRGAAVLLVFLFHYGGGLRAHNPLIRTVGYLTQAGWMGVNLFFVLSGFLITRLLTEAVFQSSTRRPSLRQSLRTFYLRRALRILPLYFFALLACAFAALLIGQPLAQLKPLLLYATFLQNIPPFSTMALHTPPPLPIYHLWSIAVEEQFYLLWPFLLLIAAIPRRALHLSLGIFAVSCVFRIWLFTTASASSPTEAAWGAFLLTRAGALALGSALALHRHATLLPEESQIAPLPCTQRVASEQSAPPGAEGRRRGWLSTAPLLVIGVSCVLTTWMAQSPHTFELHGRLSYGLLFPGADLISLAALTLALGNGFFRAVFSHRALAAVGRISYGIYVLHILLEPLFDRLGSMLTHTTSGFPYQTARLLLAFPITLTMATASFFLLERPFLRMKRHLPADDACTGTAQA